MSIENLYPSVKPSLDLNFAAGNFDPRITFSRASGATFYDGKTVAKAEENLLTYSQEFDNAAWVKTTSTVIANSFAAPDGTVSADTVIAASADSKLLQTFSATADPHTFSAYLYRKTGTGNVDISVDGVTWVTQAVTSGWVRFSTTLTPSAGSKTAGIRLAVSGDEVYIWGAQLEKRSQATAYTPTTSQPITNYVPVLQTAPANVPRIDYDPVTGECKGLLVEEQRTNLLTYSEHFSHGVWTKTNTTIVANESVAPDGALTAVKLIENSVAGEHFSQSSLVALTSGLSYTASVYIKSSGSARNVRVFLFQSEAPFNTIGVVVVNPNTGNVLSGSGTAQSVGSGWFRVSVTGATTTSGAYFRIALVSGSSTYSYTGDGYSGVYIWGAQLELGTFPTSYIKTEASQVTRAADSASMTGTNFSSWYRQDEGTLFASATGVGHIAQIGVGSDFSSRIRLTANYLGIANSENFIVSDSSGVNQVQLGQTSAGLTAFCKLAGTYATNSFGFSVNGSNPVTDATGTLGYPTSLMIGSRNSATPVAHLNGHIKRITYYPKRLSNMELQALTT